MLPVLILGKQFTKRWPDAARFDDERSPLPAAVVLIASGYEAISRSSVFIYNIDQSGSE
jgi:hypothetical protein